MGRHTSNPLILNTGSPQGCVLSLLLYSLYTHDCVARSSSNSIVKFADDTIVVGLISDNDEKDYLDEVADLTQDTCSLRIRPFAISSNNANMST